jgi:hypothetical protein
MIDEAKLNDFMGKVLGDLGSYMLRGAIPAHK